MKIYLSSGHRYPGRLHGVASHAVHDWLAKGLGELGHRVFYHLPEQPGEPLPEGVSWCDRIPPDVDVVHINHGPEDHVPATGKPWVRIEHSYPKWRGQPEDLSMPNWIYVSKTHAALCGSRRYVYNGIDPGDFIYSATKDDCYLFLFTHLRRAQQKGLEVALELARKTGIELRIAAADSDAAALRVFEEKCLAQGAVPVGEIRGAEKAELLAGARALLFPSQWPEPFGLVLAEALMSGTPVIGSDRGAIPELLNAEVGFVCADEADYISAIENVHRIDPEACRKLAMERFHYLQMARGYIGEYEAEIYNVHSPG
jgi:glycosyltransferase involved in cell wall biosynthesis